MHTANSAWSVSMVDEDPKFKTPDGRLTALFDNVLFGGHSRMIFEQISGLGGLYVRKL